MLTDRRVRRRSGSGQKGASMTLASLIENLRSSDVLLAVVHGSRVTGTARDDSDLDLLLVVADDSPTSWTNQIPNSIDGVPLDLRVLRCSHARSMLDHETSYRFLRLVLGTGQVVFGDPVTVFGDRASELCAPLDRKTATAFHAANRIDRARQLAARAAEIEAMNASLFGELAAELREKAKQAAQRAVILCDGTPPIDASSQIDAYIEACAEIVTRYVSDRV
jgi:hypothetical protein